MQHVMVEEAVERFHELFWAAVGGEEILIESASGIVQLVPMPGPENDREEAKQQ